MAEETSNLPLAGYRVLNLADDKGCSCGKLLSDLGADTIKIEPPGGDPARRTGPFYHDQPHPEKSLFWFAYYTGQRGITLNLETEQGRRIFRRLAAGSHFVIESFPPGYMRALGLGYDELARANPSMIMASITPFGQDGPGKDRKTSDLVNSAVGGMMYVIGDKDRPPIRIGAGEQSYLLAGANAAAGAMIAHYYRLMTGKGQHVDATAQEAMASGCTAHFTHWDLKDTSEDHYGFILPRIGNAFLRWKKETQRVYRMKDGYVPWMMRVAGMALNTQVLVDWMIREGEAGELKDIKWKELDLATIKPEDYERWHGIFAAFLAKHTLAEYQKEVVLRNPGYSHFPLNTTREVIENKQLAARDYWQDITYPELGATLRHPGAAYRSTGFAWKKPVRAPLIGEHNDDIYRGELGFTAEELCLLKESGVI